MRFLVMAEGWRTGDHWVQMFQQEQKRFKSFPQDSKFFALDLMDKTRMFDRLAFL